MKGLLIANTNYSLRRIFTAKNSEWRWLSACWLVKEFQAEDPIAMTNHQRTVKTNGSLQNMAEIGESGAGVDSNYEQDQIPKKMI